MAVKRPDKGHIAHITSGREVVSRTVSLGDRQDKNHGGNSGQPRWAAAG